MNGNTQSTLGQRSEESHQDRELGSSLGGELPTNVYLTVVGAFGWMMLAAWVCFGGQAGTSLALAIATVLCIVFFGLPLTLSHTRTTAMGRSDVKQFTPSSVDTATGRLSTREACRQVAFLPVALAVAAILIGATSLWLGPAAN